MASSKMTNKPVYQALTPDASGLRHVLIAHGQGGDAICRLYKSFGDDGAPIEIHYASESILGANRSAQVQALLAEKTSIHASCGELEEALRTLLESSQMGIRLYVCGTERFIWDISNLAREFGIQNDEILQEQADSQQRQVACVHCNTLNYPVRTNLVRCAGCDRQLLVRDHFSCRINAYMGLQIDAEVPGEIPAIVEAYLP